MLKPHPPNPGDNNDLARYQRDLQDAKDHPGNWGGPEMSREEKLMIEARADVKEKMKTPEEPPAKGRGRPKAPEAPAPAAPSAPVAAAPADFPKDDGAGWYSLSDKTKIRGKVEAEAAQAVLDKELADKQ